MANKKQKIFVGLSGGVDSAVTAALLKEQGHEVIAVFMQNWSQDFAGCCNLERDVMDAREVANHLDIPFYVWNFEKEYQNKVLGYFFREYEAGRTPNPDVICNSEIKFKVFLERALKLGADKIATGHYARLTEDKDGVHLLKGVDPSKDQSYFLARLNQVQLSKAVFPLGGMKKTAVRQLARKLNLPNAQKKDSQGICFIGKIDVRDFLATRIKPSPGDIVDTEGGVLGQHQGLAFYTIGQRQGVGNIAGGPYYVVAKDKANNKLVISHNPFDSQLWRQNALVSELHWLNGQQSLPADFKVVIRYHHEAVPAVLSQQDSQWLVEFTKVQRAITEGQIAAFYDGDELIASAIIEAAK